MLAKTRHSPAGSAAPGAVPETITGPVANGSQGATHADAAPAQAPPTASSGEPRVQHLRRKALRGRLHSYAVLAVALVAFLIALAASNTAHIKVNWVFGSSHVSLVWLVLFAAILGWLLGLLASARFHWRTRAPRRGKAA